ncbi:MAG: glycosyltransferase family 2 protein [Clostridia bacterium]|nr:glycosyltransferase family 2 protein [Clostridia bacterium]
MNITVIVTVDEYSRLLGDALKSLCIQTDEDFGVLIVLMKGASEADRATARDYCGKYVGFDMLETDITDLAEARNKALESIGTEYFILLDGNSFLGSESIESLNNILKDSKPDIVLMRYYTEGDGRSSYDVFADMAVLAEGMTKYDKAVLYTMQYNNKLFRKKIPDLYGVRFESLPCFSLARFTMQLVFTDAKIIGAPDAAIAQSIFYVEDGFPPEMMPSSENFRCFNDVMFRMFDTAKSVLAEDSGDLDGTEYYIAEFCHRWFDLLASIFYRHFWFLTNEDFVAMRDTFEELSKPLSETRRKRINDAYADLRFPSIFMSRDDAAAMPALSFIIGESKPEVGVFVNSLFCQDFPCFELFLTEAGAEVVNPLYRDFPNVHVLPADDFFNRARAEARSKRVLVIKNFAPISPDVLPGLMKAKIPAGLTQFEFARRRKTETVKKDLKKKGLGIS